jgi:hypothetical protein
MESVYSAVRTDSIYKTDTLRLQRVNMSAVNRSINQSTNDSLRKLHYIRFALFWDITQRRVLILPPTFRENVSVPSSRVNKSFSSRTSWLSKTGPIRCHETSVKDYHLTLSNIPEERKPEIRDTLWTIKFARAIYFDNYRSSLSAASPLRAWPVGCVSYCNTENERTGSGNSQLPDKITALYKTHKSVTLLRHLDLWQITSFLQRLSLR